MPFVWAKKTSLFDEVKLDMFYPQGIQLSRKERLSLIWLASNYDPEKYKKIIPARDCEGADIVQICSAITNPTYPHALRLSAQLLLGTVRVYRTKARLLLQLAEQMMMKLSSLLKEASLSTAINIVGVARPEAITMVDGCISIIDYSLEPVYYDPQMIMHMNEDDMIVLNSPFSSPIKMQKGKKEPSTPKKAAQSPLVVSNRTISITEDLLSPNRPILVPGEEEFGPDPFGQAQDNFLEDLNFEDFINDRGGVLPPVFEEDEEENDLYNRKEIDSKRRRLDDLLMDELGELSKELNDDAAPIDLDKVLRDAISINFPTLDNGSAGSVAKAQEKTGLDEVLSIDLNGQYDIEMDLGEESRTFENKTMRGEPIDWENQLETPADAIILKPQPSQPRKKRKLQVDKTTKLTSQEIRGNLANPESLVRMPISAGTILSGAKELFERPILANMRRNPALKKWWDNNTIRGSKNKNKRKLNIVKPTSSEESDDFLELPKSPEVARLHDDTHSSIDIPRAGSASLRSLEQSSGSTMLVNQTPIDDALSSKSILFELDENFGDIQAQPSPRISGIDVLPDVVEADLNEIGGPLLDPIPENDRDADNTLVNEDIDEVEKSFFTIGDDDDHLPKHLSKYQQRVMNKTESTNSLENSTSFFAIYPHSSTKRRDATLAFYTCLNLTKNSFINMEQNEVYGDIRIWKKT